MPQKETLDKAAYTCLLVFYRRLPPLFQFSLPAVTLVYLSQWIYPERQGGRLGEGKDGGGGGYSAERVANSLSYSPWLFKGTENQYLRAVPQKAKSNLLPSSTPISTKVGQIILHLHSVS
jgi:hypothetical protein